MSILNDLLSAGQMGEPDRLDYVIREHEQLLSRVEALIELLRSKGLITDEEASQLAPKPESSE